MKSTLIAALLILLTACDRDPSNSGGGDSGPRRPKPLPECADPLAVRITFPDTGRVFGYEVQVGFSADRIFQTVNADATQTEILLSLPRRDDADYYLSFLRRGMTGNDDRTASTTIHLPSCANRQEWQKLHTSYEEPVVITPAWNIQPTRRSD
jgi:hypothetical protein